MSPQDAATRDVFARYKLGALLNAGALKLTSALKPMASIKPMAALPKVPNVARVASPPLASRPAESTIGKDLHRTLQTTMNAAGAE